MLTEIDERVLNANRAKEPYFHDKGGLDYPLSRRGGNNDEPVWYSNLNHDTNTARDSTRARKRTDRCASACV